MCVGAQCLVSAVPLLAVVDAEDLEQRGVAETELQRAGRLWLSCGPDLSCSSVAGG